MIWRAFVIIVAIPAAVVAAGCLVWLIFISPVLLLAGHLGWMRRDLAIDFAVAPAEFLALCAALEVLARLFVTWFDDELRTGGWVSYWWREWWARLRK
ncbi:hypothetical protein [Methylobacterium planeticum]|uniref:Uncharacterized protein n=1 Tax=Methylobacterium planeticum TaxID=2615211 RepID=A0A6N6MQG6_9HYPH|nr:hypothetical protein [Methylobacterium planeticum]KAB1071655.1 hypothetical protein F6X51_19025 [Methylobacterium planeticum]